MSPRSPLESIHQDQTLRFYKAIAAPFDFAQGRREVVPIPALLMQPVLCSEAIWLTRIAVGLNCVTPVMDGNGAGLC